jgi:pyridoxamine 5'-phosphate oxidase
MPAPTPEEQARLAAMRAEYGQHPLRREDLKPDPIEQFALWFQQARDAKLLEPNAMSLATVSADGQPSLRTVLLKAFDNRGFVFYTNLQSRKAREIGANPRVSLLFPWIALERQAIVFGSVERVSMGETLAYFMTRPRGSQIAAWISNQSSVISSRKMLEMEWEKMKHKYAQGEVPVPSFWGGFRVIPRQIEFWQGGASRLHDRFMYTRQTDGSWTIEQLAP